MLENIIMVFILLGALAYFLKVTFKKNNGCGGCAVKNTCSSDKKNREVGISIDRISKRKDQ